MDIKIETFTVTADKDNRLDEKWTFEIEDTVCWHSDEMVEELSKILMEEILKDDE